MDWSIELEKVVIKNYGVHNQKQMWNCARWKKWYSGFMCCYISIEWNTKNLKINKRTKQKKTQPSARNEQSKQKKKKTAKNQNPM